MKNFKHHNAGYLAIALLIFVASGFTPSYFSSLMRGASKFDFYTHLHAGLMVSWIIMLIVQPFLIKYKKVNLHRRIGKISYFLMPLLLLSIFFLMHHRLNFPLQTFDLPEGVEAPEGVNVAHLAFYVVTMDFILMTICYILGIYYKKKATFHARFMIGAAIVILEPAFTRTILFHVVPANPVIPVMGSILLIDILFIGLIIGERKQKSGRWIFPMLLGFALFFQVILITGGPMSDAWNSFALWFKGLNIS